MNPSVCPSLPPAPDCDVAWVMTIILSALALVIGFVIGAGGRD